MERMGVQHSFIVSFYLGDLHRFPCVPQLRYINRPGPKILTFGRKNQIANTTMKFLIVLSALAAVAFAKPGFASLGYASYPGAHAYGYSSFGAAGFPSAYSYNSVVAPAVAVAAPAVVAAPVVKAVAAPAVAVAGIKTQYHSQDAHGQASYGHSEPFQSHNAVQDAHGNKVGSFSYVAPSGQVFRTDYVADALGYRVSSNALPVGPSAGPHPVAETPEVAAARAAHLAAHHYRGKRGIAAITLGHDPVTIGHTPASTAPLGAGVPAPVSYHAPIAYAAPLAYAAPISYVAPHAGYSIFHH